MQSIIDQLTNSDYRRNSNEHPEDWNNITGLEENLVYRLNIKHPNSNEPERMLVVIDGYISTYYDIENGEIFTTRDDTPAPPIPATIGNLTKKQLREKVEKAQINFGVDSNFFSLLTSVKTLSLATQTNMGPNATAAHEWVRNLWTAKYYSQTMAHEGPYSFSDEGIEELEIGFGDVENEPLA